MSRRPTDPAGYLVDARLALEWGLADHIFPTTSALSGRRRSALLRWIELQVPRDEHLGVRHAA